MKIRVFQSDKGDCLLVSSKDKKNMLVDGGMRKSFREHAAKEISKIGKKGEALDLVYVSHIDQDHISGILELMENTLEWRAYKYQTEQNNTFIKKPKVPQPPHIKSIWHNAFESQLDNQAAWVETALRSRGSILSLGSEDWQAKEAEKFSELITSKKEAVYLSQQISSKLLNIPLNQEFGGDLMFVTVPVTSTKLGAMKISVVGPFWEDIEELREEWEKWLNSAEGKEAISKVKDKIKGQKKKMDLSQSSELRDSLSIGLSKLGNRKNVTVPNLASLMLVVEENNKKLLLTGDGHGEDVNFGLQQTGSFDPEQGVHFDYIKVHHHGSKNNTNKSYWKNTTADHYIFCGNGAHKNPHLDIIQAIIDSRIGNNKGNHPEVGNKFKLWFNSSSQVTKTKYKSQMKKIEKLVAKEEKKSNGKMKYQFLNKDSFLIS